MALPISIITLLQLHEIIDTVFRTIIIMIGKARCYKSYQMVQILDILTATLAYALGIRFML